MGNGFTLSIAKGRQQPHSRHDLTRCGERFDWFGGLGNWLSRMKWLPHSIQIKFGASKGRFVIVSGLSEEMLKSLHSKQADHLFTKKC